MDFKTQFEELAEKVTRGRVSDDAARVVILAQEHHNRARDQLQSVLALKDKGIQFGEGDDAIKFEAGTDKHKGFITGISIALQFIGEFPIKVADVCDDDEEEE